MRNDLRDAIRSLRKSPTYTVVVVTVLALGIGAATAIFSVVDATVLRGLPFDEHDRLVAVLERGSHGGELFGGTTTPQTFLDWRAHQQAFESFAAVSSTAFGLRDPEGHPQTVRATRATADFFRVLRVAPMLGRPFTPSEESFGRHRVALLSYGLWQGQYGGDPGVAGKTIVLDDEPWQILGVMPPGFAYPVASALPTDLYVPAAFRDEDRVRGTNRNFGRTAIGRLKPGITVAQASDQMTRLCAALDRQYPDWAKGIRPQVITLHEHIVGRARSWMILLLSAVGLVLLVACANVANLMLARATVRARELAVRAALGASRVAIARGLLVEALLLSLTATVVGAFLAWVGVRAITPWLPSTLPRVASIAIDLRVLGAAIAAGLAVGLGFGLAPALHSSRANLSVALKDGGRAATVGGNAHRLRSALVVSEVALAVVLVVGAGLFIGSFAKLMQIDPGFDYRHVLAINVGVRLQPGNLADAFARGPSYVQRMLDAVRRVPGVQAAEAVSNGIPLSGNWSNTGVRIPGRAEFKSITEGMERRAVTPGYLRLLRVPLRRGRHLSADDRADTQRVIVINEAAARKYWPDRDAVGEHMVINGEDRVVVGVVGNIRDFGPEAPVRQEGYVPLTQTQTPGAALMMRTSGDPLKLLPAVKAAIWSVSRDQRIGGPIFTLEGFMDGMISQRRFMMTLLALFGVLGLVISAAGIYGVMAYLVAQRTSEIGVRMALGAAPRAVVAMVLRRAALLVSLGVAIGGGASWYLGAVVKTFLFQVEPTDPRVFAGSLLVLVLAGLGASAVPARRAAAVDPLIALRRE